MSAVISFSPPFGFSGSGRWFGTVSGFVLPLTSQPYRRDLCQPTTGSRDSREELPSHTSLDLGFAAHLPYRPRRDVRAAVVPFALPSRRYHVSDCLTEEWPTGKMRDPARGRTPKQSTHD